MTPGSGAAWTSAGAVDLADRRLIHLAHQTIRLDYVGGPNPIYIGWALPGTTTGQKGWRLARVTYDGNGNPIAIEWAENTVAYAFKWDDRATFSYG